MELPRLYCKDSDQQFSNVEYGRLLGVVQSVEDTKDLIFGHEGHNRYVSYCDPILPLTPPNTRTPYDIVDGDHAHCLPPGRKFDVYQQLLYFYTNHPDTRVPVSIATDLLSEIEPPTQCSRSRLDYLPLTEDRGMVVWATGPDLRTLGVGLLATDALTSKQPASSFLDWAKCHAPLRWNPVRGYSITGAIQYVEVKRIKDKVIVCARTNYFVALFDASISEVTVELDCFSLHRTDNTIVLSALNPFVFGECVIATVTGLYLVSGRSEVKTLVHPSESVLSGLCFGPHPRCIVVAEGNRVYKMDWRTSPVSTVDLSCQSQHITCLSCDPHDPFCVLVATPSSLLVLDCRQPGCTPFSVLHHLPEPPISIATAVNHNENLVLLSSANECVVCAYYHIPPHRLTVLPHIVTELSSVPHKLLAGGVSCGGQLSHVTYRFTRPLSGVSLVASLNNTCVALVMTTLGDVFYQRWRYEAKLSILFKDTLTPCFRHGYELWIGEAFTQEKELSKYWDLNFKPLLDLHPIMDYLLLDMTTPTADKATPTAEKTTPTADMTTPITLCINCHLLLRTYHQDIDPAQHPSCLATTEQHCSFCGVVCEPPNKLPVRGLSRKTYLLPSSAPPGLASLRETCATPQPITQLEHALMKGWDNHTPLETETQPACKVEESEVNTSTATKRTQSRIPF